MREWLVGRNPVYEVLRAKRRDVFRLLVSAGSEEKGRLAEIIHLAALRKVKAERASRQQLDALGENHQGVALEVSAYPYASLSDIQDLAIQKQEPLFVLLLDMIQNPQNLGTLLRTAEAVGVHGVVIPLAHTASITPAVVHASSGASEYLRVAQANLAQAMVTLKEAGAWVVGLEGSSAGKPPSQIPLDGPLALVVGNEGEGMRDLVRKSCDYLLALPMHGRVESLNAAVAGSIILYLAMQARHKNQ